MLSESELIALVKDHIVCVEPSASEDDIESLRENLKDTVWSRTKCYDSVVFAAISFDAILRNAK